jgi:hypothetical protein
VKRESHLPWKFPGKAQLSECVGHRSLFVEIRQNLPDAMQIEQPAALCDRCLRIVQRDIFEQPHLDDLKFVV